MQRVKINTKDNRLFGLVPREVAYSIVDRPNLVAGPKKDPCIKTLDEFLELMTVGELHVALMQRRLIAKNDCSVFNGKRN